MKIAISFFSCFLFCAAVFAQPKPVTLNGELSMSTGETFPYKLVITEANGVVGGYSLTYKEPNETKTLIRGTLDRRMHTLSFKETEIVYSHTMRTKAYMCLADARLTYIPAKGNSLKGPITSMEADKTACTSGSVTFSNEDEIQLLFAYHDKLDTVINMKARVRAPAAQAAPAVPPPEQALVTDKVTAGTEKTYEWHSDTIVVDAWDGGNTDGDRITILYNGKPVLSSYFLVKERKQLRLPVKMGETGVVTIVAENEGSDPPNTASLLFTDGTNRYSLLAYNNKGGKSVVKIKRVK